MANGFGDEGNFGHLGSRDGSRDAGGLGRAVPGADNGAEQSHHADHSHSDHADDGDAADTGTAVALDSGELSRAAAGQSPDQIRESISGKHVCPFCGSINEAEQGVCPRCTMENNAATRKATKSRIGPWYVLQTRNPAAPGMKFETLIGFVRKGRVKPRSIVRGPTTHQLWKFAVQVKGLSREFGVCYSCGNSIDTSASLCPQCNRLQDPPANPDVLLETKDAPAPAAASKPSRFKEPDLAEVDAEFVVPALGTGSEDSMSGVTLTGSMAGIAFDPTAFTRGENNPGARAKKDEGFLSPKDLAAAFKLSIAPSVDPDAAEASIRPFPAAPAAGERRRTQREREARDARDLRSGREFQPRPRGGRAAGAPAYSPRTADPGDALGALGTDFEFDVREAMAPARPARRRGAASSAADGSIDRPAPRRYRALKVFLFLMFFTAGLFGVALYLDTGLREQAQQWYQRALHALDATGDRVPAARGGRGAGGLAEPGSQGDRAGGRSAAAGTAGPSMPSDSTPSPIGGSDGQRDAADSTDATGSATGAQANPSDLTTGNDASPFPATQASAVTPRLGSPATGPATEPLATHGHSSVESPVTLSHPTIPAGGTGLAPPATPTSPSRPATRPSAPLPPASPTITAPPGAAASSATLQRTVLSLYREAMRLEETRPNDALNDYKAIKKYPREIWPSDLDMRIQRAEKLTQAR